MRISLFAVLGVTVVVGTAAIALSTDANAASRRRHHATRIVRHVYSARWDVNPISGTPRWNAAGGAS
jgi:hypothetical protein